MMYHRYQQHMKYGVMQCSLYSRRLSNAENPKDPDKRRIGNKCQSVSNVFFSVLPLQFSSEMSGLEGVLLKWPLGLLQEEAGSPSTQEIILPDYQSILQDTEVRQCVCVCGSCVCIFFSLSVHRSCRVENNSTQNSTHFRL